MFGRYVRPRMLVATTKRMYSAPVTARTTSRSISKLVGTSIVVSSIAMYMSTVTIDASVEPVEYRSNSGLGRSGGAGDVTFSQPTAVPAGPSLDDAQIASILNRKAHSIALKRGVVGRYDVSQYAANRAIEDSYAIEGSIPAATNENGSLFAVFDGHSGAAASIFCRQYLLHYLQVYRAQNWTSQLIDVMPFIHADSHFLHQSIADGKMDNGLSGACLNVVHVDHIARTVRCANAGDCRAIIGRRIESRRELSPAEKHGHQSNPVHIAISLSKDHQIDTNPSERDRLLNEHPNEPDVIKRNRVMGRLQPTRGFADGAYKLVAYYNHKIQTFGERYRASTWRPPYTTAEPEIVTHQLTEADEFMILSSDGLFQDLDSQEVVEYVSEWMQNQSINQSSEKSNASNDGWFSRVWGRSNKESAPPTTQTNAGSHLIERALYHASQRQIGRRIGHNANLSWILQQPLTNRRNIHDDLTVIVVFFDHENANGNSNPITYELSVPPSLERAVRESDKMQQGPIKSKL